jgi:hypothetical protein
MRLSATLATLTAMFVIPFPGMDHTTAVADSPVKAGAVDNVRDSVEEAITLAVPYLERAGEAWIEKRQCVSCHQVPFMLWSLSAAAEQGYKIDRDRLRDWTAWSVDVRSFVKPEQKDDLEPASTLAANIDTLTALLLGLPNQEGLEANKQSGRVNWRQSFAKALVENQLAEGSWQPCGQLPAQKRPLQETTQVTTAWTLLALHHEGVSPEHVPTALSTLQNDTPASTEWWVTRLLLANQLSDAQAAFFRQELINKQHSDGGWGWLTNDPSDALATGMALYALCHHQEEKDGKTIAAAVRFLTSNQSPDGFWKVPGTKKTTRNKPTPTSNYWGTAWAVIGLLESER